MQAEAETDAGRTLTLSAAHTLHVLVSEGKRSPCLSLRVCVHFRLYVRCVCVCFLFRLGLIVSFRPGPVRSKCAHRFYLSLRLRLSLAAIAAMPGLPWRWR